MCTSCVFDNGLERGQCETPEALEIRPQLRNARRIDLIETTRSLGVVHDESDVLEDLEMLGYRGSRYRKTSGQLPNSKGLFGQQLEDGEPSGLGQDTERGPFVSLHER
jgi:hypothetical protein